jgi:hypothetical protein
MSVLADLGGGIYSHRKNCLHFGNPAVTSGCGGLAFSLDDINQRVGVNAQKTSEWSRGFTS